MISLFKFYTTVN